MQLCRAFSQARAKNSIAAIFIDVHCVSQSHDIIDKVDGNSFAVGHQVQDQSVTLWPRT